MTIDKDKIIDFLLATNFFRDLPIPILEQLVKELVPVFLTGGDLLIKEGDIGDSLYLVISGRLRAYHQNLKHEVVNIGEMGRGEIIGELALLTQEPRAASVIAIRDSQVLKLSKKSFDEFAKNHPLQLLNIVKHSISRIIHHSNKSRNTITTIAVIPAGACVEYKNFANSLAAGLNTDASTIHLSSAKLNEWKNVADYAQIRLEDERNAEISGWLNEQENNFRYLVYEADRELTPWTRRCIRQADRVILVADGTNIELSKTELELFSKSQQIPRIVDLVIVHRHETFSLETKLWIKNRTVESHHHIRKDSNNDIDRLIRFITGQSIGLVLAGGGARGLVHIGVYKALLELGIPIDIVGGTSAGAIIAVMIAMDMSVADIIKVMQTNIQSNKKLFDYTIPIVSVLKAHSCTRMLVNVFGADFRMEDSWRRCFVVSSNISKGEIMVHDEGLAWKAIRASISLPGIVPPVTSDEGDILIDGGIVNNLPVDVMRKFGNGGKILAIDIASKNERHGTFNPDGWLSGWKLLGQRMNPFRKINLGAPSIAEIIYESIVLCSRRHVKLMASEADTYIEINADNYKLFDFAAVEQLADIGYEAAMRALAG